MIIEFMDDIGWQKHPYAMLNDATSLRDRQYIDGFIEFLIPGDGYDRHFAESITDSTHTYYLVDRDAKIVVKHLSAMEHIHNV